MVPSYGMLVLDCDRAKDGAESGMAIIGGLLRQAFSNDEDFFRLERSEFTLHLEGFICTTGFLNG